MVEPESEKLLHLQPAGVAGALQVARHESEVERLVSRRDRRVRREDRVPRHGLEGFGDGETEVLAESPQSLQGEERHVALVQMPDAGLDPERLEGAHAADAEKDLLAYAVLP